MPQKTEEEAARRRDRLAGAFGNAGARREPHRVSVAVIAVCLAMAALVAGAASSARAGTLDKVKSSSSIALGYRTASPPFSSSERGGQPVGYSIDLCLRVVAAVKQT